MYVRDVCVCMCIYIPVKKCSYKDLRTTNGTHGEVDAALGTVGGDHDT